MDDDDDDNDNNSNTGPDIVLIDRENKTPLVIDIAVPLTFPKLRERKLQNMEIWPWTSTISGSLTAYLYAP